MYILLALMLILHIINLFFIYKICQKIEIKLNAFCLCIFALAPLLIEALYWISASTRIVFSLFLCLASIYLILETFDEENKTKKIIKLISAVVLNLLCVGYYEQTIALNLFFFIFVMICKKKYKYISIPIISTIWIGIYYIYFMINQNTQARAALNLSGILITVVDCVRMIYNNFKNGINSFLLSLNYGTETILNSIFSIVLFGVVLYTIFYIFKNNCVKDENKRICRKLILGGTLFVSPFLPFVVLETNYIAMRNMYLSSLGIAVIIETIFDVILKNIKNGNAYNVIKTSMLGLIMITFVISNVDGCNNYKKVYELDNKVAKQIIENIDEKAFKDKKTISINYNYDELIKYKNLSNNVNSVVEADWALMGKLQVSKQKVGVGLIYINSKENEADYVLYFDNEMNLVYNKQN